MQVKYSLHIGPVRISPLVGASLWVFYLVGTMTVPLVVGGDIKSKAVQ